MPCGHFVHATTSKWRLFPCRGQNRKRNRRRTPPASHQVHLHKRCGALRRSSASFTAVSFNTKVSSRESASVFRKTRPQTEGKPLSLCIKRKKQWISRTLLKNVQRQLKKVPDYDIVLPHNPLQHEVLEAMKRFFQNRQYDVLVSLRQLLLTAAVLCLFCIPCFAGEWSVSLGMNGGDADTITGDLSLRYTLNPFYGNDMLEIRPLIECAGVYWKRDHDAIWGGGIAGGAVVDFWREGSWRPYVSGSFGDSCFPTIKSPRTPLAATSSSAPKEVPVSALENPIAMMFRLTWPIFPTPASTTTTPASIPMAFHTDSAFRRPHEKEATYPPLRR